MKKSLKYYFEQLKYQEPVISIEDVRSFLNKKESDDRGYPKLLNAERKLKVGAQKTILAIAAAVLVLVVSFLWNLTSNPKTQLPAYSSHSVIENRWISLVKNLDRRSNPADLGIRLVGYKQSANVPIKNEVPLHLRVKVQPNERILNQIGIATEEGKVMYSGNITGGGYVRFVATAEDESVMVRDAFSNANEYDFYPLFMTDETGKHSVKYAFSSEPDDKLSEGYFEKVMNELIPVEVSIPGAKDKFVVFWYKATPRFFTIIEGGNYGDENTGKSEMQLPEDDGVKFRAEVFPNPTNGKISINVRSEMENESITIDLLDMSGRRVKTIVSNQGLSISMNHFQSDISDFSDGIYFLRISSSTGKYSIQRLFKQ